MYDISELDVTGKEVATLILIVFVLLLGAGFAGYCIGWERAEDVYCNGSGADIPGVQLEPIIVHQHEITDGIKEAAGTGGAIAESSGAIKESAGAIAGGVSEAGRLIDECQQIVGRVRNRAEENKVTH